MKPNKYITIISLVAMLAITGCSTLMKPSKPKTININMTHSGRCHIENKIVPVSEINKCVKAAGANKNSRIIITVPKDINNITVKNILVTLSEGGYRKVHLQKPLEAVAYVNDDKKKKR